MTDNVPAGETRLDRIERHLEAIAEENRKIAGWFSQWRKDSAERQKKLDQQIDKVSKDIAFLYAVVNGHVRQSSPPAHQAD